MTANRRLKSALESLKTSRDFTSDLAVDPLRFVHRYSTDKDMEIAGVFASALAFGRVSSFGPVIEEIMTIADQNGGPRAWIESFDKDSEITISSIRYRWLREPDFALLAYTLQITLLSFKDLGTAFITQMRSNDPDLRDPLRRFIDLLRENSIIAAKGLGLNADTFGELPRGFKSLLSSPQSGSACKRWNLYLRWMIRKEKPDLGLWDIPPAKLRIPLDAHVHRISWLIGITSRKNADDKAVTELTEALRGLDPKDPIRYDFSLSHLGISGDCKSQPIPKICKKCSLKGVCRISPYCEVK